MGGLHADTPSGSPSSWACWGAGDTLAACSYLDESPVMTCLSTVLVAPVKQGADRERRRRLHQYTRECGFFRELCRYIGAAGTRSTRCRGPVRHVARAGNLPRMSVRPTDVVTARSEEGGGRGRLSRTA